MKVPIRVLTESEATPGSFHDCYVKGVRWPDRFTLVIDLEYITEWIQPTVESGGSYRFMIAEARLVFLGAAPAQISFEWSSGALGAVISAMRVLESRPTPNGKTEHHYELEFSEPDASILVWATSYVVDLLSEPVLCKVSSITE